MKKITLLALSLMVLFCFNAKANVVSVETAKQVALTFYNLNYPPAGHTTNSAVLKFTQSEADSTPDFYVFDITPANGFVVVSATDQVVPILGYSNESNFNTNFSKTGLVNWVNKITGQIHHAITYHTTPDSRIINAWSAYQHGILEASARSSSVSPLCATTWNQEPNYNADCPTYGGQQCVTGCVATAMAQIMKKWNYPPMGQGSFTYHDLTSYGYSLDIGVLSANFGTTNYAWTSMPNSIYSYNAAIATLMSHCGISVAMDYGPGGSGAFVLQTEADEAYGYYNAPCAQYSYVNYFLYDPATIKGVHQQDYSTSTWDTMLENELNIGRPIEYEGSDPGEGGHTWVCDGYDANNRFHMNWGWGGIDNGYFYVTDLDGGGYVFDENDAVLMGIQPLGYDPGEPGGPGTCVTYHPSPTQLANASFSSVYPTTPGVTSDILSQQWTWSSVPGEVRSVMKLDVSAIPAKAYVTAAYISFIADDTSHLGYYDEPTYGSNNASYLQQVTSNWSSSVTWNTQPTITTTNEVALPQSTNYTENYPNIDITKFVQGWVENPSTNYGMELKTQGSTYYNSMVFYSSTNADTFNRPQIQICYYPCNASAAFLYQSAGGNLIQFTNSSTSNMGFECSWAFYNSTGLFATSNATNPQILFTGYPPYTARLLITDSLNQSCFDSVTESITYNPNTVCNILQHASTKCQGAELSSNFPTTNFDFSTYDEMHTLAWTVSGVPVTSQSLFKFDLSSVVPPGVAIISATLTLSSDSLNTYNGYLGQPMYGTNDASKLYMVTSSWDPATVTWNTAPYYSTTSPVILAQSTSPIEDYTLDVTNFVQNWNDNPSQNYGMLLKMNTSQYYNSMIFCSPSFADSSRWPKLEVCYVMSCQTIASFVQQNLGGGVVKFTNTSVSNNGYTCQWTFFDNGVPFATSTAFDPTVTFNGPQPYIAKLVIKDSLLNCTDSTTQSVVVNNCTLLQAGTTSATGAQINSSQPSANNDFTRYAEIDAIKWDTVGSTFEDRSLMRFNLSTIPVGAVIQSADLSLFSDHHNTSGYNGEPTYGTSNSCYLHYITSSWDPSTVSWVTQPSYSSTMLVTLPQSVGYTEDYTNIDISSFVQQWVNNPSHNYGMALSLIGSGYENSMIFCSPSYSDSTLWPKLEVCYQLAPPCHLAASFDQQNLGSGVVQFTNTSTVDSSATLSWTFYNQSGVFSTSTQANPRITFTGLPPYSATLLISDSVNGCIDTINKVVSISDCDIYQYAGTAAVGAILNSVDSTTNFNLANDPELLTLRWNNGSGVTFENSLFQFNLSGIPAGSSVQSAQLSLYADPTNTDGTTGQPTYGTNNASFIYMVTSPWQPSSVTWKTAPTLSAATPATLALSTSSTENYLGIDISDFAQHWINSPDSNYGLLLDMISQTGDNSMIFCSPSYPDSTKWPKLEVCFFPASACATTASFTFQQLTGDTVWFTNTSVSSPTYSSQWTFYNQTGAFATSTQANPEIAFTGQPPYSATLIVTNSLRSTCIDTITQVLTPSAINNVSQPEISMTIFPNPNNGSSFYLRLPSWFNGKGGEIAVYDILGREITANVTQANSNLYNVSLASGTAAGIYTVAFRYQDKQLCGKLTLIK